MTASKPGQGQIVSKLVGGTLGGRDGIRSEGVVNGDFGATRKPRLDGAWRPNTPFSSDVGVQVTLQREPGITTGDVLRVPLRLQTPVIGDLDRQWNAPRAVSDTISRGQRSRPQGPQLQEVSFEVILMDLPAANETHGVEIWGGARDPQGVLRELRGLAGLVGGLEQQEFRLTLAQPAVWHAPLVSMVANLTAIGAVQRAGETGTEYVRLTFQEWPEDQAIARRGRPRRHGAGKITWQPGDTLHSIALRSHYRRASAAGLIAKANGIKGVSYSSAAELAAWLNRPGRHRSKTFKIPAG